MAATTKVLGNVKLTDEILTGYTIDSGSVTTAMLAADAVTEDKIADAFVSRVTTAESDIDALESSVSTLQTQIAGVSGAMHFKGTADSLPTSGDYAAGDVVVVGSKEYVCTAASPLTWAELGDVTATDARVTTLEGEMDTAQSDIDALETAVSALQAQGSFVQQTAPTDLTTANTMTEIMTQVNTIVAKLVSAGIFATA